MTVRLFTDETIKRHIKKYGKECYVKGIQERIEEGEKNYNARKKKLTHILERIESDFSLD